MPPPSQILPNLPTYFQVFEAGQLTLVQHSIVSEQAHAAAARNPARHHAAARHGGLYFLAHIDQKLLEDSGPAHHVLHRQGSIFFTTKITSPPIMFPLTFKTSHQLFVPLFNSPTVILYIFCYPCPSSLVNSTDRHFFPRERVSCKI